MHTSSGQFHGLSTLNLTGSTAISSWGGVSSSASWGSSGDAQGCAVNCVFTAELRRRVQRPCAIEIGC